MTCYVLYVLLFFAQKTILEMRNNMNEKFITIAFIIPIQFKQNDLNVLWNGIEHTKAVITIKKDSCL
jgi:hypothetical protein